MPMKLRNLSGGLEPRRSTSSKSKRRPTRAEQLARAARVLLALAPSEALAADISQGRTPYPAHLMPLSRCRTLNADPRTTENYNPTGERGERRHTPRQNRREEDEIDGMSPRRAAKQSKGWPSSCGTVVNAGQVLRDAGRLNRVR